MTWLGWSSSSDRRSARQGNSERTVDDIDATYERALESGAQSLEEPGDTPYGDRRGMVEDPCGNIWQIATHKGTAA